jgi:hypothetical protein
MIAADAILIYHCIVVKQIAANYSVDAMRTQAFAASQISNGGIICAEDTRAWQGRSATVLDDGTSASIIGSTVTAPPPNPMLSFGEQVYTDSGLLVRKSLYDTQKEEPIQDNEAEADKSMSVQHVHEETRIIE